ncbi:MAG: formamidopyrimidine-DNA glycosylase [Actinomycetota bacterium]|nr:formamidopyrimidine-DNA glycosylase [Actinomycetota bacterium]MDQ1671168.1 formamidopyrimidine-DNA glycosylase [Actinomycetota bacterium]
MPELPEVEALAGFLTERAVGRVVARVDVANISVLKTFDPPVTALGGLEIVGATRWGKFLDVDVSGLHLIVHLARGGWLRWRDSLPAAPARPGKSPLAARVHLDDGSGWDLTEMGTQKRLAMYVVRSPYDVPGIARLGPDPLAPEFDVTALAAILSGSRQQIKGLLRDQSVLAGVGNAYSDEVLHAARLSPFKLSSSLTEGEVETLYAALRDVLTDAVTRSAGMAAAELKAEKKLALRVHGRAGQPCPVCGDTVREVSFADSALQYCPTCQTGGKPLADRRLSRLLK